MIKGIMNVNETPIIYSAWLETQSFDTILKCDITVVCTGFILKGVNLTRWSPDTYEERIEIMKNLNRKSREKMKEIIEKEILNDPDILFEIDVQKFNAKFAMGDE